MSAAVAGGGEGGAAEAAGITCSMAGEASRAIGSWRDCTSREGGVAMDGVGRVSIEQAVAHLAELVGWMEPGDEIVLTQDSRPVAKIIPSRSGPRQRRPGSCKGMLIIREDDEEHLNDFKDYMP